MARMRCVMLAVVLVFTWTIAEGETSLSDRGKQPPTDADQGASFRPFLVKEEDVDFGQVASFEQRTSRRILPWGPGEERERVTEYCQEVLMEDGGRWIARYQLLDSAAEASKVTRLLVSSVAAPSRKVDAPKRLGLQGADELYVFKAYPPRATLALRYSRLWVLISVLPGPSGDAARTRDSLARIVLGRAKSESGQAALKRRSLTNQGGKQRAVDEETVARFKPFLLKKEDLAFGRVERVRQFPESRKLTIGSAEEGQSVTGYRQEIFLHDGRLCIARYLLLESRAEASEVMQADAKEATWLSPKAAEPETLGLAGADGLYVFGVSGINTNLAFRFSRLYVVVSVLNDATGEAANVRNSLARIILSRARAGLGPTSAPPSGE
jgi:hypothetical protein